MQIDPADTQAAEDEALRTEQANIPALVTDDRPTEIVPEAPAVPVKDETKTDDEKVDPRTARMEQLASRSREREGDELTRMTEATVDHAAPKPVAEAPVAERMMKIKVRGEIVEMPESEVIARAQKVDAADSYLTEARTLLEDAKKTARTPAAEAPKPVAEVKKVDPLLEAIEKIQIGGDVGEIRDAIDKEIDRRATDAARNVRAQDDLQTRVQSFDREVDAGYAEFAKDHADLAKDPVATNVVVSLAGGMEGELIARYLADAKTPENIKSTFAQAGITAEGVRKYAPGDAHALFKDMHLKGYPLPPPAAVIKGAGATVAQRLAGTTKPVVPTPAPPVLDRTKRKDAIQQPERASIPRAEHGHFAPKSEPERAQTARDEIRGARRAGAARR